MMQGELHGVLEQWVSSIRMRDMHEDCQPSTNLKSSASQRQQQRVERKLAQVRVPSAVLIVYMVVACVDAPALLPACASWFAACVPTASVPSAARHFVTPLLLP
jgi:hypothetical protein